MRNLGAEILIMGPFTITMMVTQSMAQVNDEQNSHKHLGRRSVAVVDFVIAD